jgi:hypothetical protein
LRGTDINPLEDAVVASSGNLDDDGQAFVQDDGLLVAAMIKDTPCRAPDARRGGLALRGALDERYSRDLPVVLRVV